jgi:AraC-like DNA-binding protein
LSFVIPISLAFYAKIYMLGEDLDAASAGYRVRYGDASHFNREYKRLFGAPPVRDVERLREVKAMNFVGAVIAGRRTYDLSVP